MSAPALADPFSLEGRVAIVTGASGGLGDRFTRVLAARGASVLAAGRRVERLASLAGELEGVVPVACDVARDEDLVALVETALQRFGRVDVLVNNAGTVHHGPAEDEPIEEFRRVIEVNLNAVFRLSQLAARPMLAQESGSIVNISSIFGLGASAPIAQASYGASKGAIVNLTRDLAGQWMRRGVRVNAIAPGFFPSGMTDEIFSEEGSMRWIRRNTPAGRPGREHELDGALLLLASDAGSYITGQTIAVDGGWTAR
jgi:NAD(P)-dependent dehydrogenase (short-subunit alcohol dehydrogenase family)